MTRLSKTHLAHLYPNLVNALETGDCKSMFEGSGRAQLREALQEALNNQLRREQR